VTYDVVVAVDNPEQILMPGMTAYVNITIAQRKNVLLVPNTALRFKPVDAAPKKMEPRSKEERKKAPGGTVYVLEKNNLKTVRINTGISDNKFTEVVSGDLKAGNQAVTAEAISSTDTGQSSGIMKMRMF
jgi:HlyD family secretion protein